MEGPDSSFEEIRRQHLVGSGFYPLAMPSSADKSTILRGRAFFDSTSVIHQGLQVSIDIDQSLTTSHVMSYRQTHPPPHEFI
jgi:hypothetical protein